MEGGSFGGCPVFPRKGNKILWPSVDSLQSQFSVGSKGYLKLFLWDLKHRKHSVTESHPNRGKFSSWNTLSNLSPVCVRGTSPLGSRGLERKDFSKEGISLAEGGVSLLGTRSETAPACGVLLAPLCQALTPALLLALSEAVQCRVLVSRVEFSSVRSSPPLQSPRITALGHPALPGPARTLTAEFQPILGRYHKSKTCKWHTP